MFKIAFLRVFALVFITLIIVGCVSAPVQEMSDARQAIRAASNSAGQPQLNDDLLKARHLLKDAESALAEGEYKEAREKAEAARDFAMQAQKVARNIE
jgi:PBP1b-binding outer membrane lipoprotein LpoB